MCVAFSQSEQLLNNVNSLLLKERHESNTIVEQGLNPTSQWNTSAAMKRDIFVKKPKVTCHIELVELNALFS